MGVEITELVETLDRIQDQLREANRLKRVELILEVRRQGGDVALGGASLDGDISLHDLLLDAQHDNTYQEPGR